jgi:CrcB protein
LAFPWGTLAVNVAGSFTLGVIAGLGQGLWQPGLELRALLVTGVLGAFTTFSAFSLDVVTLVERGATAWSVVYVLVSVIASIGALFAALALFRLA